MDAEEFLSRLENYLTDDQLGPHGPGTLKDARLRPRQFGSRNRRGQNNNSHSSNKPNMFASIAMISALTSPRIGWETAGPKFFSEAEREHSTAISNFSSRMNH